MQRAVGFDLDMTLVDTRRGIELALLALAAQTGRPIDAASIVASLGPPIDEALSPWFSPKELPEAVQAFRGCMAEVGVQHVTALPGAGEALGAARAAGFTVVVITSKVEPLARATLRNAGLTADRVFGNMWALRKAAPLIATHAACFVGDHPGDMLAAVQARVAGLGVTTGSSTEAELLDAGATQVAATLSEFPRWLDSVIA